MMFDEPNNMLIVNDETSTAKLIINEKTTCYRQALVGSSDLLLPTNDLVVEPSDNPKDIDIQRNNSYPDENTMNLDQKGVS